WLKPRSCEILARTASALKTTALRSGASVLARVVLPAPGNPMIRIFRCILSPCSDLGFALCHYSAELSREAPDDWHSGDQWSCRADRAGRLIFISLHTVPMTSSPNFITARRPSPGRLLCIAASSSRVRPRDALRCLRAHKLPAIAKFHLPSQGLGVRGTVLRPSMLRRRQ